MKILYVYEHMPKVYQHYLLRLLNAIKQVGNVKTFSYQPDSEADYSFHKNVFKNWFYRLFFGAAKRQTMAYDIQTMRKFDIVHLQHSFLWKKLLPLLDMASRPKIVITLRGGDTYLKPWTYRTLAEFYSKQSHQIDAFVVMSNHQKEYLRRWQVPSSKIHMVPISFGDPTHAKPKYPNLDVLRLVSAFRMTWEKNIEAHLQFARQLKKRKAPFMYDIYGDGKDLDQLYFLVDKYELSDVVSIKGKIDNDKLRTVLPNYDFFLQLSSTESLGMSVIEAQAYGLPCVVSDAGGLPEVVLKDKTAFVGDYNAVDELAENCLKLWKDKERYHEFSKEAIAFVHSKFTLEQELENLKNLYHTIQKVS